MLPIGWPPLVTAGYIVPEYQPDHRTICAAASDAAPGTSQSDPMDASMPYAHMTSAPTDGMESRVSGLAYASDAGLPSMPNFENSDWTNATTLLSMHAVSSRASFSGQGNSLRGSSRRDRCTGELMAEEFKERSFSVSVRSVDRDSLAENPAKVQRAPRAQS